MGMASNYGFIGLGLIGGSIAKRLKKVHSEYHLIAYSRTRANLELAHADGVIDEIADEVDERFRDCDVIYLCTPVSFNEMYLAKLKDVIGINTIITDVGSTKAEIGECVHALGLDRQFCGGHPMAGSEKTGYENANDHLMENGLVDGLTKYILGKLDIANDLTGNIVQCYVRHIFFPPYFSCDTFSRSFSSSVTMLPCSCMWSASRSAS